MKSADNTFDKHRKHLATIKFIQIRRNVLGLDRAAFICVHLFGIKTYYPSQYEQ